MAKIIGLPHQDLIDTFKGTLDFYVHRGIMCCRSWPRPPTGPRSPAVQYQWEIWSKAARLWTEQTDIIHDAARQMVQGGTLTGRDLSMALYINAQETYPDITDNVWTDPPPSWVKA